MIFQATPPPSPPPLVTPAPSPSATVTPMPPGASPLPSPSATPAPSPSPTVVPTPLPSPGALPPSVRLSVTGDPVDPTWLEDRIAEAIAQNASVLPGATLAIGSYTLPPLAPGAIAGIPVPVQLGGAQYASISAIVNVDLRDVAAAPFSPPWLLFDDDPEMLDANGVIYRGTVNNSTPARLYYYHENTAVPRRLLVVLSGGSASSVQLIDSSAGPSIDVMSVGHQVSLGFLQQKPRNEGVVLDLQPGQTYVADAFELKDLDGAAGCIGINVLSGGPVHVTVLTAPPASGTDPESDLTQLLEQAPLSGDGHGRTGIFALNGYGDRVLGYTAGGPDASVEYGTTSPPQADGSTGHDYGGYGVLRTLTFQIQNLDGRPQNVYLYERPLGGDVRSSFLVDGNLVQLGCARLPERYEIGPPLAVPPGASQVVVQTMDDGGSNYPLEVGMTATPPLSATPAIHAPDGCFPNP